MEPLSPHALQILTTEHWRLLSSRSLGYTESMVMCLAGFAAVVRRSIVASRRMIVARFPS